MALLADLSLGLVILLHVVFLVLEMFLWRRFMGPRFLGRRPEVIEAAAPLAANQGLYNGFLAAGLIWGLLGGGPAVRLFFLSCCLVAGLFGAATASRTIFWLQALPSAIALALNWPQG
ncbi:MAG: DUF1304 domain-containing protein [Gammaproteobacteria bacterium]|nr:MAG: DUF1304 domain-containing protein [Gammaproteobacteria bacterium]